MKKIPFYTFIVLFGLFGCSSQKKLSSDAPFTITAASCQDFASGREEGGTGFTLEFPFEGEVSSIDFQKVYFRGHILNPELKTLEGTTVLVCRYEKNKADEGKGMVMHADPREEIGNQPPAMLKDNQEDYPFKLNEGEAVIQYSLIGKKKVNYFKLTGVKEKMPVQYPSQPKN